MSLGRTPPTDNTTRVVALAVRSSAASTAGYQIHILQHYHNYIDSQCFYDMPCVSFGIKERSREPSSSGEASTASASSSRAVSREGSREASKERPGEGTRARSSSSDRSSPHRRHHRPAVELHESQWRSFGLFDRLNEAQLNKTVSRMVVKNYHEGDKIISKGTIGTSVVRVCMCVCVRACVRVCMCVCVRARVCVSIYLSLSLSLSLSL
jgi:hypothetical protein